MYAKLDWKAYELEFQCITNYMDGQEEEENSELLNFDIIFRLEEYLRKNWCIPF